MSGPNPFSMRRAISGVSAALPCRRSDSVARRTCKISAAFGHVEAEGFDDFGFNQVARMGGFFMGIAGLSLVLVVFAGLALLPLAVGGGRLLRSGDGVRLFTGAL